MALFTILLACSSACLLFSTGSATAAQSSLAPLLAPVVSQQGSIQSYDYENSASSCLRVSNVPMCNYDEGYGEYMEFGIWRQNVACCSPRHNKDYNNDADAFLPGAVADVGKCDFSYIYTYYNGEDLPLLAGSFTGVCYLNAAAQECVEPFCDNMVLSAQGSIYEYEEGILVTDIPDTDTPLEVCFETEGKKVAAPRNGTKGEERKRAIGPRMRKKMAKGARARGSRGVHQPTAAKPASINYNTHEDDHRTLYSVIYADVMVGPMTVTSTTSGKTWHGWLNMIPFWEIDETPLTAADAVGRKLVRSTEMRLKIFKENESS